MAGLHQIWALALDDDCIWRKGRFIKKGSCFSVAGNGNEENRNNNYPHQASFAQPSGLTYSRCYNCLYVADSESSSIRSISLTNGIVKGVVGGAADPTDLFAFGDADGTGTEAKLQHPLGLAWSGDRKLLYIADTYNHKVKAISPETRSCYTLPLDCVLREPGGLCLVGCDHLMIANTQQHDLVKISLNDLSSVKLLLVDLGTDEDTVDSSCEEITSVPDWTIQLAPGGHVKISFSMLLEGGLTFSMAAPQCWWLKFQNEESPIICVDGKRGKLELDRKPTEVNFQVKDDFSTSGSYMTKLLAKIYICDETSSICLCRNSEWTICICITETGQLEQIIEFEWRICK